MTREQIMSVFKYSNLMCVEIELLLYSFEVELKGKLLRSLYV